MRIEFETDKGKVLWAEGQLTCPAVVLADFQRADRFKAYGLMPGVSLAEAFKYPDSMLDLVMTTYPKAKVKMDSPIDNGSNDGLIK